MHAMTPEVMESYRLQDLQLVLKHELNGLPEKLP
jgi:hypothetical protein